MQHDPFQIARGTLLASVAVMVAVASLPNPNPSPAWKIAEGKRHQERFPAGKLRQESAPQLANGNLREPGVPTEALPETSARPIRTALLPRLESGDDRPRTRRFQEPIRFFEEEEPSPRDRVPDPVHIEPPGKMSDSPPTGF